MQKGHEIQATLKPLGTLLRLGHLCIKRLSISFALPLSSSRSFPCSGKHARFLARLWEKRKKEDDIRCTNAKDKKLGATVT